MIATLEAPTARLTAQDEEFLAKLTQAAYAAALRHRPRGAFLDVQLDLWTALREVVAEEHGTASA